MRPSHDLRDELARQREHNNELTFACTSPACGLIFDGEDEDGVAPDCVLCSSPTQRHMPER